MGIYIPVSIFNFLLYLAPPNYLEQSYFYTYSRYSEDLYEIGFEQQTLVTEGGTANYFIEIVDASEEGFIARATSVIDFDKDGNYNEWEINQDKIIRESVKD